MTDAELGKIYDGHGYCKFLRIAPRTFKAMCTLMRSTRIGPQIRKHNHVGEGCLDCQKHWQNRVMNWMRARRFYYLLYGTVRYGEMTRASRRRKRTQR